MTGIVIRDAELWQGVHRPPYRGDLRIEGGTIAAVGHLPPRPDETVIEAKGGLLLPGLHDHHMHLAALAAKRASLICGPPQVRDEAGLGARLAALQGTGWVRGILYHESVMGLPDAAALDRLLPHRPLRIQHRSGRMWFFNSPGLAEVLAAAAPPPGLERDGRGFTGRLFDEDGWLRTVLAGTPPPFADVSMELARLGVTGLTDMSPANDPAFAAHIAREMARGHLMQRVTLAGTLALNETIPAPWTMGPAKLHLHEAALPDPDEAAAFITAAHRQGRAVAIHCTTEVELVYALAVLKAAGTAPRQDRIEHAGIAPDSLIGKIAVMGLAVVSQPHFIAERGDAYRTAVPAGEHGWLYRLATFQAAGIPLAAGSDAPFGTCDPWAAMQAAVTRQTHDGATLGAGEALTCEAALALYLADPADLARQRTLTPGTDADLVLLDRPWREVRRPFTSHHVRATFIGGYLIGSA